MPLLLCVPLTTLLIKGLSLLPPFRWTYAVAMSLVSIPLLGLLIVMSRTWERVPLLQLPMAFVGIPVALLSYMVVCLAAGPSRADKGYKLSLCDSFPYSHMVR